MGAKKKRAVESPGGFNDLFSAGVFAESNGTGVVDFIKQAVDDFFWSLNSNEQYEQESYGDVREHGFHPSAIGAMECSRSAVLEYMQVPGIEQHDDIDPKLRRIFDNGHEVHDRWQRYFTLLAKKGQVRFVGSWKCKGCGFVESPDKEIDCPDKACPKCGSNRWKYNEFKLRDPKRRITGKRDGKIIIPELGLTMLLEVKSINGMQFTKLNGALDKHIVQANIYMDLDPEGVDMILFLYECKNTQAVKWFLVKKDMSKIKKQMDVLAEANKNLDKYSVPAKFKDFPKAICSSCKYYLFCKKDADEKPYVEKFKAECEKKPSSPKQKKSLTKN